MLFDALAFQLSPKELTLDVHDGPADFPECPLDNIDCGVSGWIAVF